MARGKRSGWFRRKKGALIYTWVNDVGKERAKVVGPNTMSDSEGWTRVGELGLNKLAFKPDPQRITFGELATQYVDQYPFNKLSTRELHAQIIRRQLLPKWFDAVAVEIEPKKLKAWFNGFDVESATRGKYKSVMNGVYRWGQCEGILPRGEQYNPCKYVTGREFSQVSGYEAMAMAPEDILLLLANCRGLSTRLPC